MKYNRRVASVVSIDPAEIVGLNDVKQFIRVDTSDDDELILDMISAALGAAEKFTGRAIRSTTIDLVMDAFPIALDDDAIVGLGAGMHSVSLAAFQIGGSAFDLPYPPVSSVTSITTYSTSNAATVLSSAAYLLANDRISLNSGYSWPTGLRDRAAVAVRYVAGYGSSIPAQIRIAVMQHVDAMYDCRGGCDIPAASRAALIGYRIMDQMAW